MKRLDTLWLPLARVRIAWLTCGTHFFLLAWTMTTDLSHYDSPELALVAVSGGLSHPIGQPLHTILGLFAAHLPGIDSLTGLNAFSALMGGLCILPLFSLIERCVGPLSRRQAFGAGATLLLFGQHMVLWEPFTRIEVYPLACFLSLWSLAKGAAWLSGPPTEARHTGFAVGVGLGLCGAAHAYTALITACALVIPCTLALRSRDIRLGSVRRVVSGGLLGLAPYLYVPLVAFQDEGVFVWSRPQTASSLMAYFQGQDYDANRQTELSAFFEHYQEWLAWAMECALLPWLVLGCMGWWVGRNRFTTAPAVMALLGVSLLAYNTIFQVGILDYLGYIAPASFLAAGGCAALILRCLKGGLPMRVGALALGVGFLICIGSAGPPPWDRTRDADDLTRVMSEGVLEEAPRDAIVVAASSHWVGPLLYLQEAEQVRPDVTVVIYGFASSSWFWQYLAARHPDLVMPPLRGPGGRLGRLARLFAANPGRPVLIEDGALAQGLQLPFCGVGFFLHLGAECPPGWGPESATERLEQRNMQLGAGAPGAMEVQAAVALIRGEALWRLGQGAPAMRALLAGVPLRDRPAVPSVPAAAWARLRPLGGGGFSFVDPVATGEPARPLFVLGHLMRAVGDHERAQAYWERARVLGLREVAAQ